MSHLPRGAHHLNSEGASRLARILADDLRWQDDSAACASVDPDLFFPARGEDPYHARRICKSCPLLEPCREYGLAHPELWGVWGGLGSQQRRDVRMGRAS